MTLLAGGHWQDKRDRDDDGWADLAGYSRGVIRPRLFWSDGSGRSLFATGGAMRDYFAANVIEDVFIKRQTPGF